MEKPYCLMPFLHFHVGNKGIVKACCVANIPYGNINESTLDDIWNGEAINTLRQKFLKGETDNRCKYCHQLEAAGAESIRQETFMKFPHLGVSSLPKYPVYFDIRFSNVCNFRCRTCWHGASSKWFNDAKILGTNIGHQAILKNVKDVNDFIGKMGEALLQAEEFYFAGGEPLVTEEHYILLDWLIKNKATQARLRYNTNFSKLSFKQYQVIDYWRHFPTVEILASIDAVGDLGTYVRKEMKWQDILDNRELIKPYQHIDFKIAPTVSVFNIRHIVDLYKTALSLNFIDAEGMYINILERPNYYNIQILSKVQKEKVSQEILDFMQTDIPLNIKQSLQEILDYLWVKDQSHLWDLFQQKSKELDDIRNETPPIVF